MQAIVCPRRSIRQSFLSYQGLKAHNCMDYHSIVDMCLCIPTWCSSFVDIYLNLFVMACMCHTKICNLFSIMLNLHDRFLFVENGAKRHGTTLKN